ncbi:DNA helicase [Tanacetum coccineum]|uniref:DNA helicase n=1 Tax=Tanacetum coccineum TaxID=301880 RepID=A0ABQ5HFM6_9ASTR
MGLNCHFHFMFKIKASKELSVMINEAQNCGKSGLELQISKQKQTPDMAATTLRVWLPRQDSGINELINNGRGPYIFKIYGQIYHWIGTLCPFVGDPPRFCQLYIYDTQNEVANRLQHFGGSESCGLDPHTVEGLIHLLDECNELVRLFRTDRDKCNEQSVPDFKIRLYSVVGAREYDLPTSQTLGAIVFKSGHNTETDYDFHKRFDSYGLQFRAGRLFQQYVVGVYCYIEQNRTDYYTQHQADIRKDYLSGIYDAISQGDREGCEIGSRILLPMSFTGGPRYMYSHYLDALAICRVLGNPQYFITFTCNVNWPEIKRHIEEYLGLLPGDRADIVVRVFQHKVNDFCNYLTTSQLFGSVRGLLYTIEFQKWGLPHCHTLLWVDNKDKIQHTADVDRYISAELPDPKTDPDGYPVISEMMVHGPCSPIDPNASCMKEGEYSKNFPKKFNRETFFDKNGHIHYRRRDTGVEVTRRGIDLDNCYTVPYNRQLCLTFHAHINVECCGWSMLIKYFFKYISKGTDKTVAQITKHVGESDEHVGRTEVHVDEIQNFVDGHFICPHEACWQILKFKIHNRHPVVQHGANLKAVDLTDNNIALNLDEELLREVVANLLSCSKRTKEEDVLKISTSVFMTNFPEQASAKDIWNACKLYGHVVDAFIPNKRSKAGKRFEFMRFIKVFDVKHLVGNLCTVWIGRHRIHANAARFHRPKGSTSSHQPAMKEKIRDSSIGNTKDNGHRDDDYLCGLNGKVNEVGVLENLKVALGNEGFTDIDLRYMGGLWVMIAFDSVEAKEKFLLSTGVCSWFSQLIQASSEFITDERVTMVEIEGIPLKVWNENTFIRIASKWGTLLNVENLEKENYHCKRLCVLTKSMSHIFESFKINYKGKTHWVRAIEIPGWTPDLDDQNDEESDSEDEECEEVFKKDFGESDEEVQGENDVSRVSDTEVEEENPKSKDGVVSSEQNGKQSEDPFNIYSLLNKDKMKNNKEASTKESLEYPPGFTPRENDVENVEMDNQKDNCDGEFGNVNNISDEVNFSSGFNTYKKAGGESMDSDHCRESEGSRKGGSILMLMDELVKVGQTMGYNMDGCMKNIEEIIESQGVDGVNFLTLQETKMESIDLFEIKRCWGNFAFDYVHSASVGKSGGILCVWDPNAFKKLNSTDSTALDYFVMDSRKVVCLMAKLLAYLLRCYAAKDVGQNEKDMGLLVNENKLKYLNKRRFVFGKECRQLLFCLKLQKNMGYNRSLADLEMIIDKGDAVVDNLH